MMIQKLTIGYEDIVHHIAAPVHLINMLAHESCTILVGRLGGNASSLRKDLHVACSCHFGNKKKERGRWYRPNVFLFLSRYFSCAS